MKRSSRNKKANAQRDGGPRTVAGKRRSRENAIDHGLTSKKLLPEILRRNGVDTYRKAFEKHYRPNSPTERVLVDELARHAAMMELGEQAEGSVLRSGAIELSVVVLSGADDAAAREDAVLSAAFATDALDKFVRYRRSHEKAFYSALKKLIEIQNARNKDLESETKPTKQTTVKQAFATEAACVDYLTHRFTKPNWKCPHCGHDRGSWLERRKCWECAGCRRQAGLRYGTVMAGSRLPLVVWFKAIRILGDDPQVTTASLADLLGIKRRETVRNMMRKIGEAMVSVDRHEKLAGLIDSTIEAGGCNPEIGVSNL